MISTTMGAAADALAAKTIRVNSSAFVFSPANWTGDKGRRGKRYRQTWYTSAYFRVTWKSSTKKPSAKLLFDTSVYPKGFSRPRISYCVDGAWTSNVTVKDEVKIKKLRGTGNHELTVVFTSYAPEIERWGSKGKSGINVLRVTGLQIDPKSKPVPGSERKKWALIIGDSITVGCGTTELTAYSYLLGKSLQTQGYEFGISACGWSGWINRGDNPPGDVPGYYVIKGSKKRKGGVYHEELSRWNKIDGNNHSLLDSKKRISGHGTTDQEPSLIFINYGTNDVLHKSNPSDVFLSITNALAALRKSAPEAKIILIIPFGQYFASLIKDALKQYRENSPNDDQVYCIDLGPEAARSLTGHGIFGGLHPNARGHANFAAQVIPQVMRIIIEDKTTK